MIYARNMISIFILTILMVSGFLALSTGQVRAQDVCEVTIEKVADPADDTGFYFSVTGGENGDGIELRDPSDPTATIILQVSDNVVTLTEEVPPGWILDDIECTIPTGGSCGNPNPPPDQTPCLTITDAPNGLNFLCLDSSEVTCTFSNSRLSRNVPTLSQWGLIAMIGLLGIIGLWAIRRKKAAA